KIAFIFENNPLETNKHTSPKIKKKINFFNWLLEIAACEVEEALEPPVKEQALIECMVRSISARVQLSPTNILSEKELEIQIHVAILRTLYHLDDPIISYYLLKTYWPQWNQSTAEGLDKLTQEILIIEKEIGEHLEHSIGSQFYGLCEKYDTIYLLLGDVLENFSNKPSSLAKALSKPKKLSSLIRNAYDKRLSTLKKRLTRSAIYSTLSVFVSGGVSLFIFEIPLAKLFYGEWKPLAIVADILLPTALMAFLVAIVKPPRKSNLERVVKETCKVAFPAKEKDVYEIKARKKRGFAIRIIVGFFYLLATFISLTFTFFIFDLAKVPVTSLYVDTLNIAVIVFAALVIRQRAKELTVEEKASFWEFIIDILSVPIAEIGQWLANKWKEYNIVSVFFIALVDMPFSSFIHFIENWSSYLKEKKSDIH
ncbi:hypothetical protein KKB40_00365, partial [Patescibacteria group bacterium]|nr:hypothetical protein [Patescibacteria group bacterium]